MLVIVFRCQLQIFVRGLLALLDNGMQQDPATLSIDVEEHARNAILLQARPHLIDTATQRPANRHPQRPTELHRLDIFADALAIVR